MMDDGRGTTDGGGRMTYGWRMRIAYQDVRVSGDQDIRIVQVGGCSTVSPVRDAVLCPADMLVVGGEWIVDTKSRE